MPDGRSPFRRAKRTKAIWHRPAAGELQLAGAGSNEIRSRMPVAAASRSSVRVDGFTNIKSRYRVSARICSSDELRNLRRYSRSATAFQ
jgi:hypothetical protein